MKIPRGWWMAAALILAVRLALLIASVPPNAPLTGDEPLYDRIARSLLAGEGITYRGEPWIGRPAGWPIVLSGIYRALGDDRRVVVACQGLFDAATALIYAWIAWRITGSRATVALTFLLVALWPPFFRESRFLQTDPLFTLFTALTVGSFVRFAAAPRWRWAAYAGAFAGFATMVRPTGLMVIAGLVLGWAILRPAAVRRHLPSVAVIALMVMVTLFPWALRNALTFRTFVPISLGGGDQFFLGTLEETQGRWDNQRWPELTRPVLEAERQRLGRPLDVFERDRALFRAGLENWKRHPTGNLVLGVKRIWRLVLVPVTRADRPLLRWGFAAVLVVLYGFAVPPGIAGLRMPNAVTGVNGMLLVTLIFYVLMGSAFYTNSRYMEPMRPIVHLLAAQGLVAAGRRWLRRRGAGSRSGARSG